MAQEAPLARRSSPYLVKRLRGGFRAFGHDLALMWRMGGMEAVREAILYRTVHRLYRRDRFLLVESSLPGDDGGSSVPGVEIRPLEDSDWDPLGQLMTTRKIERFRNRSERGRTCFVAWRGGRPIGYSWVSERVDPEIEHYPLPLPSDCVYGWDLYVNRDERGGGVGSALARARLRHARSEEAHV